MNLIRGEKDGQSSVQKMGRVYVIGDCGAHVAQHQHPIFERIGCASESGHFRTGLVSDKKVSSGDNMIFGFRIR